MKSKLLVFAINVLLSYPLVFTSMANAGTVCEGLFGDPASARWFQVPGETSESGLDMDLKFYTNRNNALKAKKTEMKRTFRAAKQALFEARQKALVIPTVDDLAASRQTADNWLNHIKKPTSIKIKKVFTFRDGIDRTTMRVLDASGRYGIFRMNNRVSLSPLSKRPKIDSQVGRKEIIVSILADLIDTDILPRSKMVHADFSGLSTKNLPEEFEGLDQVKDLKSLGMIVGSLSQVVGKKDVSDYVGPLNAQRVYDAFLLNFLISSEMHTSNLRVLKKGGLALIDFEDIIQAVDVDYFSQSIEEVDKRDPFFLLQQTIPKYYSKKILKRIKSLKRERLESALSGIATPEEIDTLLFRRLVILNHAKLFPQGVF